MAESTHEDVTISSSDVVFDEVIGNAGYTHQVYSGTLKTPSGLVCKVAAKRVREVTQEEVEDMKKLQHKNIVIFYGTLKKEFETYIVMELAEKGNLRLYLDKCQTENKARLPKEIIMKWIHEAASAIKYIEDKRYVHRDIKSVNYLLMNDYSVKLGDLAVAKDLEFTQNTRGWHGACRWMAPEVIMEQRRSIKSDVYTYGMVVWEMCTMDVPFSKIRGDFQVMTAICGGERPPIPDDVPEDLKELITLCWKVDYNERPHINDILENLEKLVSKDQTVSDELSKQLQLTTLEDESMETEEGAAKPKSLSDPSFLATDSEDTVDYWFDSEVPKGCRGSLQTTQLPWFNLVV